jgi:precorrin-3B C17-methyltransferase
MVKEKQGGESDRGRGQGAVYIVGIGPGGVKHLTLRAVTALVAADRVVGYARYLALIEPVIKGKETFSTGMTREKERCLKAVEFAGSGLKVALVSSGDAGVYGMAGLLMQLASGGDAKAKPGFKIEVVPGVPAFVGAASLLGAPIMHDFASISLSDLLTPWETIERRIEAASMADFVIILYNPRSSKRTEGLKRAIEVIGRHRKAETPVGIVRNASRQGEDVRITTLAGAGGHLEDIDMLSILIIGNSATFAGNGMMITPRGYEGV